MKVLLTYFKPSGKYYTDGEMEVPDDLEMFEIWDEVRRQQRTGNWPGLSDGPIHEFNTLVNVPDHKHDHPHLIMLK